MAYRQDDDLKFLGELKSNELNDLVRCLMYDKDDNLRITEELSMNPGYKAHAPNHNKYWEDIAAEVQMYGGNTFANLIRGKKGVPYREVLIDVCKRLKVNFNKNAPIEVIETAMLMKMMEKAMEKMSPSDMRELAEAVGVNASTSMTPQALTAAFQAVFRAGGFKSYQLTLIIVNAASKALLGKGLTFTANATLAKAMSIATGPIGWVVLGIWSAVDVAGAAYRVTVPATLHVAYLRQKHLHG